MKTPTYREENKLYRQGINHIAGLDEAGKGAWAGPVVAASVILPRTIKIPNLRDSKLLGASQRKKLYLEITKQAINWSVGIVSEKIIDEVGIVSANLMAMEKAIERLTISPDFLLIDYLKLNTSILSLSVVNGDQKIASIAAASIVAKVTRDYIMIASHKDYPKYNFHIHKGYGTDHHYQMIIKHGICVLHRRSFSPIKELFLE